VAGRVAGVGAGVALVAAALGLLLVLDHLVFLATKRKKN
jgi:hypothetical protein